MRRIFLLFCILFLPHAGSLAADGSAESPYVVFMVLWRGETDVERGFLDYFKERGISIRPIIRNLQRDLDHVPGFIAEARALSPDLIYSWGTSATLAIRGRHDLSAEAKKDYLTEIPGVFTLVSYPVEAGIIRGVESTGRNLTGVQFLAPVAAQVAAIKAYLAPDKELKTLGVIYNPKETNARISADLLAAYGEANDIQVIVEAVPLNAEDKPDASQLPSMIQEMQAREVDFLYMGADSFLTRQADIYTSAAIAANIPTFASTEAPVKNSTALFALTTSYYTLGKLTAYQAEQIMVHGQKPKYMPIRYLREFNLLLNKQAMQGLNYFPPIKILLDARIIDLEK